MVSLVSNPGELRACWIEAVSYLQPSLARSPAMSAPDLLEGIRAGRLQLWMTPGAAAVSEIRTYPRYRVCVLFLAGGELEAIKASLPGVEDWAKQHGCDEMQVIGRDGWVRALGYEKAAIIARKVL